MSMRHRLAKPADPGRDPAPRGPARALRVLIVDDSEHDATLMAAEVARGAAVEVRRADGRAALAAALDEPWDVVLVDQNVPGLDSAEVIASVRARLQEVPCVVVSGVVGEEFAVAAMKRGASDFVTKQNLGRLASVVARELAEAEVRREAARTQAALQLAAGQIDAIEASLPDRIFVFDASGRVFRAVGPPSVAGDGENAPASGADRWRALADPALESCLARALKGAATSYEWSVGAPGQERWFEARLCPVRASGGILGAVVVVRDVSELKTLNARLALADRMAAIGSIAAGVAHDLFTPVSAALAAIDEADRLARGREAALGEDGPSLLRALVDAREAACQVQCVARDLRTFSRADTGGTTADVVAVLDSAARLAAHELRARARVVREYAPVPPVAASASRLGQVFLNLIVNAAQAIRRGAPDRNEVRLRTRVAVDGRVVVEVEDTGAGMPPEVRRRLFTPFFTTKPDGVGTGLGLTICQRIVQGIGGEIDVTTEPGQGTAFRVLLPAAPAGAAPAARATGGATAPPGSAAVVDRPRVLVVDDEPAVRRAMGRLLGRVCDVACAEADLALRRLEAGERFDLVLCDVSMAGLSGIDLYARVQARHPGQAARIVFLTGGAFGPEAKAFFAATGAVVVDKGALPDEIRGAVLARLAALGRAPGR